ncbi:hypothetical protein [Pseudomonas sp. RW3S2]|uniref:hypothetical protein n=1 Tax=Pseudomonas sp. RW3S2 TaxID=485884 RepID=UPI0016459066|nr:hypothetical protein [Pseudomonas sp. RW3S2]MBC3420493.1 hypothetical protein [Pseudomonas sp. RW3S2]
MQPHQQVLAMGILWLISLIALTFIIPKARHRAFNRGLEVGKHLHKADLKLQIKGLRDDLDEARINTEAEQRKHHVVVAALKRTINELEERIMSYNGLAVTRSDYDMLINASETLVLAKKTWKAAQGTEPWCIRAMQQQQDIQALAMRIHTQLRSTPARSATAGAAA